MALKFIPILNSSAGATLSFLQWEKTGSTHFAFDVLSLLQRPGLTAFKLKAPGFKIVDCSHLTLNAKKQVRFKTTDGSFKTVEMSDFLNWLESIGTDAVIWPYADNHPDLPLWTEGLVSDKPAHDAHQGIFYDNTHIANILDKQFEKDLSLLSPDCQCETCSEGFTRAYLHHLLQHTPLLAQRFLAVHNVFFSQLHGIRAE
jgi:hypothetical protein